MNNLEIPLFNNSCGKIFNDSIILATKNREDKINFNDIKKVKFGITASFKSIIWALLPSSIFVLLYMERKELDSAIFFLLSFVSLAFTILALVMTEKNHYINVKLNEGLNVRINVSADHRKDAKKFVELCRKNMQKAKKAPGLKILKPAA